MEKVIVIGGRSVRLRGNAATGIRYKQIFGREILKDIVYLKDAEDAEKTTMLENVTRLAFVMAKQSEGDAIKHVTAEDYIDWMEQFEEADFQDETTLYEILGVWNRNLQTTSTLKNESGPQ